MKQLCMFLTLCLVSVIATAMENRQLVAERVRYCQCPDFSIERGVQKTLQKVEDFGHWLQERHIDPGYIAIGVLWTLMSAAESLAGYEAAQRGLEYPYFFRPLSSTLIHTNLSSHLLNRN